MKARAVSFLIHRLVLEPVVARTQCDHIGLFLNGLGEKCADKSIPNIVIPFWAISKYITIYAKTAVPTFWDTFEKLGYF